MNRVIVVKDGGSYTRAVCAGQCDTCHLRFVCLTQREGVVLVTWDTLNEIAKSRKRRDETKELHGKRPHFKSDNHNSRL